MRDKFQTRVHHHGVSSNAGTHSSLDAADKAMNPEHTMQVTFEDVEDRGLQGDHSHIIHYRDGEAYNDLYFINPSKF